MIRWNRSRSKNVENYIDLLPAPLNITKKDLMEAAKTTYQVFALCKRAEEKFWLGILDPKQESDLTDIVQTAELAKKQNAAVQASQLDPETKKVARRALRVMTRILHDNSIRSLNEPEEHPERAEDQGGAVSST